MGKDGKPLHYKGTHFHRVVRGLLAQGGDVTLDNGLGGESIYGDHFPDENFKIGHSKPAVVSMANEGPDTNNSHFFITFRDMPWLDGRHVVFGEVLSGFEHVHEIGTNGGDSGRVYKVMPITDSGEFNDGDALTIPLIQ